MKKGSFWWIAAVVTAFLLLAAVAVYLTLNFRDTLFTERDSSASSEQEFHFETEPKAAAAFSAGTDAADHFVIWVGDSRTVGMREAVGDGCTYIGAPGEGYEWFIASGESEMRAAIAEHPDAPVVLNLGVNDYANCGSYLERYRALADELADTVFYYMAVNPIDPAKCQNITNEEIADFNRQLKDAFPDTYLDSFTFLMTSDVIPFDGIHYSPEDYRSLHDFVIESICN